MSYWRREMKRSLFDKIKTSLWMLLSFVPLINGSGFIYIGHKMSKTRWILEGVVYELPWIVGILNFFNYPMAIVSFAFGVFMILLSIVRSVMVNYQYQELLDEAYETYPHVESGSSGVDKQIKEGQFTEKEPDKESEKKVSYEGSTKKTNPYDLSGVDRNYTGRIKFDEYKKEINELKLEFNEKNQNVKDLVEKRFVHSKLTYDRFMSIIENSEKMFHTQADYALDMIELTPEYTEKIDMELQKKIDILKSIIKKNDELRDELIINMTNDTGSEQEMENLFEDMEQLTGSIKDYE